MTWPGGSAEVVFGDQYGSVTVLADEPAGSQIPSTFPWALVLFAGGEPDEDAPEFITQTYTILSAADVAGDPLGEYGVIGGSVADLGKSAGRGVGEIAERVRAAVQDLTGADGAKIMVSLTGAGTMSPIGDGRHLVSDEHTLTALCTSALHYAAPQLLQRSGDLWTWLGPHCSDRFDFLQYRLVVKAGTTPSATPADGTVVYTGTSKTTLYTPSSNYVYTLFADYNARGGSSVEGSSGPEVGSYVVVTSI